LILVVYRLIYKKNVTNFTHLIQWTYFNDTRVYIT